FGFEGPDKIEIHDGPKDYFFTRSGSDWWGPDGKKLDAPAVENVVDKIRNLTAQQFPESGFSAAVLELIVNSDGGKRTERASLAKHGDAFIARRAGEAALYQLTESAVRELREAAANVKPFVAPK